MIFDTLNKLTSFSKQHFFQSSKDFSRKMDSYIPINRYIAINKDYPENIFLVHENMVFKNNSISDSSYDIWISDLEGENIDKFDLMKSSIDFMQKLQVIKNIQ